MLTYLLVQDILENKKNHPAFAGLLRSKGFIWLATRPNQHGEWSQSGGILTIGGGFPWFCTVPRSKSRHLCVDRLLTLTQMIGHRMMISLRRLMLIFRARGVIDDKRLSL
jgi:G3E family GTPase